LGHIKRNCNEFAKFREVAQDRRRGAYGAAAHAQHEEESSEEGIGLLVSHALAVQTSNFRGKWIVDSGATSHMCNNQHLFGKFKALTQHLEVTLGDGHALKATGRGTVTLKMNISNGKESKCTLHDVLLVPDLAYNLFSVSRATEAGKSTEFTKSSCSIREEKGNRLVAQGYREGSLYYLDHQEIPAQAHAASSETWHRRFGHLGTQSLMQLNKDQMVRGLKLNPSVTEAPKVCEPCLKGRQHRNPFSVGTGRAAGPLDLVHSDVCGKMGSPSLSGSEYFVTFIDSYSHYTWVYVLKRKDQVFESFLKWKALVENSTGRKLKVLRTDNGGEFTSRKFKEHLSQHGIRHETTVPKNPEQNGTAERMNRTLMESVRSMLADSALPQKFWAEALSTAVYLKNRSPTKSLSKTTPFEAWSEEKPDVSHLRVFGCNAYSHVPRDERGKLDSKTKKCLMLGYGSTTKGYRLYDIDRKRVFYSHDVVCDEQGTLFQKNTPRQEFSQENGAGVQKEITNQEGEPVEIDCEGDPMEEDQAPGPGCSESEENPDGEEDPASGPRHSERPRKKPDWFGNWAACLASEEPTTLKEAVTAPEAAEWRRAMEKELDSLKSNEVWTLTDLPQGKTIVGSKWVYKRKTGVDGSVIRYKARLVARGFSQKFGCDYDETFSPVVRGESIRALLALATQEDYSGGHASPSDGRSNCLFKW